MSLPSGIIFGIRLEVFPPVERTRFNRKFLWYTDRSQNGKYSYSRPGFMLDIPHVHLSNSIFIILEKYLDRVKVITENETRRNENCLKGVDPDQWAKAIRSHTGTDQR